MVWYLGVYVLFFHWCNSGHDVCYCGFLGVDVHVRTVGQYFYIYSVVRLRDLLHFPMEKTLYWGLWGGVLFRCRRWQMFSVRVRFYFSGDCSLGYL